MALLFLLAHFGHSFRLLYQRFKVENWPEIEPLVVFNEVPCFVVEIVPVELDLQDWWQFSESYEFPRVLLSEIICLVLVVALEVLRLQVLSNAAFDVWIAVDNETERVESFLPR